jgi:hypothetical protein
MAETRPVPTKGTKREGAVYRRLTEDAELADWLRHGTVSQSMVAHHLGVSQAEVSRAWATYLDWERVDRDANAWEMRPLHRAMLPQDKLMRLYELGPEAEDTAEFNRLADELTRAYSVFSRFFFTLEGNRPLIKDFHLTWIRSIIVAWATGAKQLILSPPRHGKSEMLIRFCVWMIVMFPNIRIIWISANTDVASIMLGAVKDHLQNNMALRQATLPPGTSYKPPSNSGKPWSASEIKVAQQTHTGQKSSSLVALGRTSATLSRDVDIFIVDDLEDFDSTEQYGQRLKSKKKFGEWGTRKEERTAWINICSRQNPDDLPGSLLRAKDSQSWRPIVNSAHDRHCDLDPDIIEGHDENGCVLFPEVRSYRWLMEKKGEMDTLGIPGAYEMRYLNRPIPEHGTIFRIDRIRELLDRSRDIGADQLGPGTLMAGLDLASRGTQAGFLWHWVEPTLSMVDLLTQAGGGFAGGHELMELWYQMYGLQYWWVEDNNMQIEFLRDPRTIRLADRYGLVIQGHNTGMNKHDPELGISSMAPWYHDGRINLPYGTAPAITKVQQLLDQLEMWTTDGIIKKRHSGDIKMASWFPFPTLVRSLVGTQEIDMELGAETSYPGISSFSEAPWSPTQYPGGQP